MANSQRSMLLFLGICNFSMQWIPTQQEVNVALNGIASQSSTFENTYIASFAVDGNRSTSLLVQSCSCTNDDYNPWWKVDLLGVYYISKVIITNRRDCCSERINGAEIHMGKSPLNNGNNNPRCGVIYSTALNEPLRYSCNMTGRYVSIIIPNINQFLTLCEVEVYGYSVKRTFLRIEFNSSEDLTSPTVRDNVLQKIKSTNAQSSAFKIRWTKEPELETET